MTSAIDYLKSGLREGIIRHGRVAFKDTGGRAVKRLNILLPHFHKEYAFGGVLSAMQVARALSAQYESVRFVSMYPLGPEERMFDFADYVLDAPRKPVEVVQAIEGEVLACHEREVFFCTYWTTVLLWREYAARLSEKGLPPRPFYYFIQDYEPGFYPMGCKQALALSTYEHGPMTHAVYNSMSLAAHFDRLGYDFAAKYVLPPSLNPEIRAHLEARAYRLEPKDPAPLRVLVYGRPEQPRNCFATLMEGLFLFFAGLSEEERAGFYIASAGQPHDDILLAPGATVQSLGKLSMPEYIKLLERCHIGVSLMATPHPSYPPLEMALFGLYAISTAYGAKTLKGRHPNLHALEQPTPESLAVELARAVNAVRSGRVKTDEAVIPTCMSVKDWGENVKQLAIKKL